MKSEWAPIELWAWKETEKLSNTCNNFDEDMMRKWLLEHWFEYPALGLDERQYANG